MHNEALYVAFSHMACYRILGKAYDISRGDAWVQSELYKIYSNLCKFKVIN